MPANTVSIKPRRCVSGSQRIPVLCLITVLPVCSCSDTDFIFSCNDGKVGCSCSLLMTILKWRLHKYGTRACLPDQECPGRHLSKRKECQRLETFHTPGREVKGTQAGHQSEETANAVILKLKEIVHKKKKENVIYSPILNPKFVRISFFCVTQKVMFF